MSYPVNLIQITKEDDNPVLIWEYNRAYDEMIRVIKGERTREARNREDGLRTEGADNLEPGIHPSGGGNGTESGPA